MAWQFNNSGLGAEVGAGLSRAEESIAKEKERLRQQAIDGMKAEEWGAEGRFRKPVRDKNGNVSGYEIDIPAFEKARAYARSKLPGNKKPSPVDGIKEIVPYQQKMQEAGLDPATGNPVAPAAPSTPTPLLSNPGEMKAKETQMKLDADAQASADDLEFKRTEQQARIDSEKRKEVNERILPSGKKALVAEGNTGVTYDSADQGNPAGPGKNLLVAKTSVNAQEPLPVEGSFTKEQPGVDPSMVNSVPEPIPVQEEEQEQDPLDVDPYTLKRIIDQVTTPSATKDGLQNQMIMSDQLDPEIQERLGVRGLSIPLPFSFVARGIQSKTAETKPEAELNPELYDVVDQVAKGMPVGTALRLFQQSVKRQVNPREEKVIREAAGVYTGKTVPTEMKAEEAAKKDRATDEKKQAANKIRMRKAETVLQDGRRALSLLEKQKNGVPGALKQKVGSFVPGSEAADLEALLDTIKTIGGFEELQAMREASPTGGALGPVSDAENKMLQQTIGNLGNSGSPQLRAENLKRVLNTYLDVIDGEGQGPKRFELPFTKEDSEVGRSPKGEGFKQTKKESKFLTLQAETASFMRAIDESDKNPSEKRALKKKAADRFFDASKKYTDDGAGIPWSGK